MRASLLDGIMIPHNPSQTISSQEMIDMTSSTYVTIGGSIPDYPLVKAHGKHQEG